MQRSETDTDDYDRKLSSWITICKFSSFPEFLKTVHLPENLCSRTEKCFIFILER